MTYKDVVKMTSTLQEEATNVGFNIYVTKNKIMTVGMWKTTGINIVIIMILLIIILRNTVGNGRCCFQIHHHLEYTLTDNIYLLLFVLVVINLSCCSQSGLPA